VQDLERVTVGGRGERRPERRGRDTEGRESRGSRSGNVLSLGMNNSLTFSKKKERYQKKPLKRIIGRISNQNSTKTLKRRLDYSNSQDLLNNSRFSQSYRLRQMDSTLQKSRVSTSSHQGYVRLDEDSINILFLVYSRENRAEKAVQFFQPNSAIRPNVNLIGEDGWAALHYACMNNNKAYAQFLLRQGADIDSIGKGGVTPLFLAVLGYF
jgi:hypothetical protein